MSKTLLIIAHVPSENTLALANAIVTGACSPEVSGVNALLKAPLDVVSDDIIAADAIIIGTTENLGYMAGLSKDVFDRCYYDCLELTQGKPFSLYIRAGHDGTGTRRALETITTGLRWRLVHEPLILRGDFKTDFLTQCEDLGLLIAASLEAGII